MPRWEGTLADIRRRRLDGRRAWFWLAGAFCATAVASSNAALADPPPWILTARAPTQNQVAYRFPSGLKDGRCRPDMFDAAAVRGLVGPGRGLRSSARRGAGGPATKLDNTAIGTLLSAISGKQPSHGISRRDEICFSQSFEHAPDRRTVAWTNATLTVQFSVIPLRTLQTSDGRFCREYAAKATINGHAADVYGTACRQPDGNWFLVD
jgi:surface antigen